MSFKQVWIREALLTERELLELDHLSRQRQLTLFVTTAVKEHLNKMNPDLDATKTRAEIKAEADITAYLAFMKTQRPDIRNFELQMTKEFLEKELQKGSFRIINSGAIVHE